MRAVPVSRVRALNNAPVATAGRYVLYWMTSARRLEYNFSLQHAVDRAIALGKPLVILEALRCDYPFASDRLHRFVLDGMAEHQRALAGTAVRYIPYVEPSLGAGKQLLTSLSAHASLIVTDWFPAFFLPRMLNAAARQVEVRMDAVDANGIVPVSSAGKAFTTARSMRAHLQRTLAEHLRDWPERAPIERLPARRAAQLPGHVRERWPAADLRALATRGLAVLPIDHSVAPVAIRGGSHAARSRLSSFVAEGLPRYAAEHSQPEADATSRLSPWLHFGHLSAQEVFAAVASRERWTSRRLTSPSRGAREGWWKMSADAESFLDELITWRELAFNTCEMLPQFGSFDSLPAWAQQTLNRHRRDRRRPRYPFDAFDAADTHDPLWNAIQRQLRRDGWFHGYMRMLWGKKILEWSATPEEALDTMERLMNRYSLDGRDPVSWAGFGWVLGRYDRPWPERHIFGTVRYMSSANTARKLRTTQYVARYS